jgi:amino acid transporter
LVGYGAIILGFLGGVHWGFTLSDKGDDDAVRSRLLLGVAPALVGWAAVILSIVTEPVFSLILLTAGFIGAVVVETRAHRRGLMPDGYLMLRWVISVVVILILTIVTVLRFFGARVLL